EPAPFVLMLQLCTAYPQDGGNGSRSHREPALDPRCMSPQSLPVTLPDRSAPALHFRSSNSRSTVSSTIVRSTGDRLRYFCIKRSAMGTAWLQSLRSLVIRCSPLRSPHSNQ